MLKPPSFDLSGRVALVTGGTRGIGGGIAEALAASGAHVVVTARNAEAVAAQAERLRAAGAKASGIAFDVNDAAATLACFEAIGREHGRLDIPVSYTHLTLPTN